ncbi:aminotransferase class I/II-fold pyridoxal phosphate-dependent enzyme [Curvibacter sp. CHRR-16]|uniref:aminotransferase class I/II-fold pyridoxal phosphate-dependent enzyme n=1 Tax=Curvibacter sp. CHRR-16 TaxID=2835872 RepID=UPI001BDA64D0|nr:aminotransferase class I/II-fold pyridoxal phosphate-dependent enzyme [Curvibacter sp. CHRR-16]MBT0569221.1 aminotransferase class I/II-fold pyridoxal phosphate-dependent enzyme [Curvibacter sp. CHRR-16]
MPPRIHGGPDALGVPRWDFSTNANACGPCPEALAAVQGADATHYPDPQYTALRAALAAWHGVDVQRVVLAASGSEFIFRITAAVARLSGVWGGEWGSGAHPARVWHPAQAFGDYAAAAQAWGLPCSSHPHDMGQDMPPHTSHDQAHAKYPGSHTLCWVCEPSSPLGQAHSPWPALDAAHATTVLDCAYEPLRLSGQPSLNAQQRELVWQLFSPNKALGLTGVRGAYAIAPAPVSAHAPALSTSLASGHAAPLLTTVQAMAPSWVLGAHGAAMLHAWVQPSVQAWLQQTLPTLRAWKQQQIDTLQAHGWQVLPSDVPFFCAQPPVGQGHGEHTGEVCAKLCAQWCTTLRQHGIKLRDATSLGLPGWVRMAVREPQAVGELVRLMTVLSDSITG